MPWYAFTRCWVCSSHTRKLQVADQALSETWLYRLEPAEWEEILRA